MTHGLPSKLIRNASAARRRLFLASLTHDRFRAGEAAAEGGGLSAGPPSR
jgi:hypothetical protein